MQAYLYELNVVETSIDYVQNYVQRIREIYIPEKHLSINIVGNHINIFESSEYRYYPNFYEASGVYQKTPVTTLINGLDIIDDFVKRLEEYYSSTKELLLLLNKLMEKENGQSI